MDIKIRDSPVVYICSPYSGDIRRNTEMARRYSRLAVDRGRVPITPHLWLPGFIPEESERELALGIGLRLLDLCDEVWACGDTISEGMRREIAHAANTGIPVKYVKEEELYVCD